jgi:hypothetical protein
MVLAVLWTSTIAATPAKNGVILEKLRNISEGQAANQY